MNKKGFTLVELLAVIAIMSLIMVLVAPTISNLSKTSNERIRDSKIKAIIAAGEKYGNDYINTYRYCDDSYNLELCTVTIGSLIKKGYLEGENGENIMIDPVSNCEFTGSVLLCYDPLMISIDAKYNAGSCN